MTQLLKSIYFEPSKGQHLVLALFASIIYNETHVF